MAELTSMQNIGKEMARKLEVVGIHSSEQLVECGAKQAFFRLKEVYPQVCLVHLYALEGAIQDVEFNNLSKMTRQKLKMFNDCLKRNRFNECSGCKTSHKCLAILLGEYRIE